MKPLFVHRLPHAPSFTGREKELDQVSQFWRTNTGVLSINGVGGSGKTALISAFLESQEVLDQANGMLVWSFYDDPDVNSFFQTAYSYFSPGTEAAAKGAGWFHLLRDALSSEKRNLLVLDGLERVQQTKTDSSGVFGQIEDPLLRGLLRRLVEGNFGTKVIITSRFPVSDLERWADRGYYTISVDQLEPSAICELLAKHNVYADSSSVERLIQSYGYHALTIDLLAGAVRRFFNSSVDQVPVLASAADDLGGQASRLSSVLRLYQEHLLDSHLDLLSRLCVFRFGVRIATLHAIFTSSTDNVVSGGLKGISERNLSEIVSSLSELHLIQFDKEGLISVHPAVRDHFYRLFRDPGYVHSAVSSHLLSLTERPGIGLPIGKESLDLLEELVYHALQAGQEDEARYVYFDRLGANDHLNTRLGEYARSHRMLTAFKECPDPSAMYHSLRAFGRYEESLKWRPQNRYIQILQGRLASLANDPSDSTRRVARYLMGEPISLPERFPDLPLPLAWLMLLRGRIDEAMSNISSELSTCMHDDDIVRLKLAMAEANRLQSNTDACNQIIGEVSPWILGSSSYEHLCLMHLIKARTAISSGDFQSATVAIEEGLQLAGDASFHLLSIDFSIEQGKMHLALGDHEATFAAASKAYVVASAEEIQYGFGLIGSLLIEFQALLGCEQTGEAIAKGQVLVEHMKRMEIANYQGIEKSLIALRSNH